MAPTWNPTRGTGEPDRWFWGSRTPLLSGATDYSTPPTEAEVNARSGLNQILAELKRRGGTTTLSYWPNNPHTRVVTADDLQTLKEDVDALRTSAGASAYTWSAIWPIAAGDRLLDQLVRELREALEYTAGPVCTAILGTVYSTTQRYLISPFPVLYGTRYKGWVPITDKGNATGIEVFRDGTYLSDETTFSTGVDLNFVTHNVPDGETPVATDYKVRAYLLSGGTRYYTDFTNTVTLYRYIP